jgi:hypothetical protein
MKIRTAKKQKAEHLAQPFDLIALIYQAALGSAAVVWARSRLFRIARLLNIHPASPSATPYSVTARRYMSVPPSGHQPYSTGFSMAMPIISSNKLAKSVPASQPPDNCPSVMYLSSGTNTRTKAAISRRKSPIISYDVRFAILTTIGVCWSQFGTVQPPQGTVKESKSQLPWSAGVASSPLKRPPVGTLQLQAPAIASPKMSGFLRLLWRNWNSARYSGRYFLLTLW